MPSGRLPALYLTSACGRNPPCGAYTGIPLPYYDPESGRDKQQIRLQNLQRAPASRFRHTGRVHRRSYGLHERIAPAPGLRMAGCHARLGACREAGTVDGAAVLVGVEGAHVAADSTRDGRWDGGVGTTQRSAGSASRHDELLLDRCPNRTSPGMNE